MIRLLSVVGARPNFMKIAPIIDELKKSADVEHCLVHSGQHYDELLSGNFFADLGLPKPDVNLQAGSGSHAVQTAEIMKRIEPVLLDYKPQMVLVVGDVNSTIAAALTAVKLGIGVAHVEAGLRSFDMEMPEEINRKLTDAISSLLFVTEQSGVENLKREGVPDEKIFLVGTYSTNASLTVSIACLLTTSQLQGTLNFARTNADSCTVRGTFSLPSNYNFTGKLVTLNVGGAETSFTLDSKGRGLSGLSRLNKPSYNKKTGLWTFNAMLRNGSWHIPWAAYGLVNATILRPGSPVTLPVVIAIDNESFMAAPNRHYTSLVGKSGRAR